MDESRDIPWRITRASCTQYGRPFMQRCQICHTRLCPRAVRPAHDISNCTSTGWFRLPIAIARSMESYASACERVRTPNPYFTGDAESICMQVMSVRLVQASASSWVPRDSLVSVQMGVI